MFSKIKKLLIYGSTPVRQLMNPNIKTIGPDDSLLTAVNAFNDTRLDTLPVVDEKGKLIAVFPRTKLYKALLAEGSLEASCRPYIVYSPRINYADILYDPVSLVDKVFSSPVGMVPVLDADKNLVGMIGKLEYLRHTLDLTIRSHVLMEGVYETMYEGLIIVDSQGMILKINSTAEKMFNLNYEEARGRFLEDVLPDMPFIRKSFFGRQFYISSLEVLVNQSAVIDDNLHTIVYNIAFLDISYFEEIILELETVKALQNTLSAVLKASTDGVFVNDRQGLVKYANERACRLLGMPQDSFAGHSIKEFKMEIPEHLFETGIPEVSVSKINGKSYIVSHAPIKEDTGKSITGIVNIIYNSENKLFEELSRKWFSSKQQARYYRNELEKRGIEGGSFNNIVTRNSGFIKMKNDAQRIAHSASTVLLTGESGVGKDMFARAIHAASLRGKHSFVKVNCAAIPESLLESELFGYAPGSFTGASKKGKIGYFDQAHQGTIFLDEIGDMPLSIQVKILQVIQDKQFTKVGGTVPQSVDVRIIAATNKDLQEMIANGTFREDLYYRLNVIEFYLPSLRNRPEDILPLAEMFINKYNHILGSSIVGISDSAKDALLKHSWPGNIRELENAIERAANYVWEGEIDVEHLPTHILLAEQDKQAPLSYRAVINDADKEIIMEALKKTNGNKSAAARLLKISRSTFYEKLAKYGL